MVRDDVLLSPAAADVIGERIALELRSVADQIETGHPDQVPDIGGWLEEAAARVRAVARFRDGDPNEMTVLVYLDLGGDRVAELCEIPGSELPSDEGMTLLYQTGRGVPDDLSLLDG